LKQQGQDAVLLARLDQIFSANHPKTIAVAVSGGSDSTALLCLAADWAKQTGTDVQAVTVDHGLRPAAQGEAQQVAALCTELNIPHTILKWQGWDGRGNTQAAARAARYQLIADWAVNQNVDAVALGHTTDDVAETFLMRLARKAGVDGLAAMSDRFERHGMFWVRPVLQHTRINLRHALERRGVSWIDDPSNDDMTQTRPQTRAILRTLAPLGIDVETVAATARSVASAKDALQNMAHHEASKRVTTDAGDVSIAMADCDDLHPEIQRRLILAAIRYVASGDYAPREGAVLQLRTALKTQYRHTVGGCLVTKTDLGLRFTRELNAVQGAVVVNPAAQPTIWDKRWSMSAPKGIDSSNLSVQALGEALKDIPDWRDLGLARATLMASPAVWQAKTLIAAPIGGYNNGWRARIVADFQSYLLSH
jgi:tRNA(Ile)-lysidine synthase